MSIPLRYDDLGTINAVKLLPKIDSYNGYIQLYTELDSHIEEGDTVFISYSGDTLNLSLSTDVILDNYTYIIYSEDFIYDSIAQGYTVLYVDKNLNTFVIDRFIHTIPKKGKLYNHYVSSIICNNINITNGVIDGSVLRNATITGNTTFTQGVIFNGDITNLDIDDKYSNNYISLILKYNSENDTYNKYSNLNNNDYGYSYFYDLNQSLYNCNIYSGNYSNCNFISSSPITGPVIDGGYFDNCYFSNYKIYDGYFKNTNNLDNGCIWHYGKWEGNTFPLNDWKDGVFINGNFGNSNNSIWQNGIFLNGTWRGTTWVNGEFSGGIFEGTGNTDVYTSQQITTTWLDGNFKGGKILNSDFNSIFWRTGKIFGGEINNLSINSGEIYGGNFYNVSVKNTDIKGGKFYTTKSNLTGNTSRYNYFANNKIYDGEFIGVWYNPLVTGSTQGLNEISDTEIFGGNFKYSALYNFNEIHNGEFEDVLFYSPITINNGKFYGGHDNFISSGETERSNYIKSRNHSLSKATIRSKTLYDSGLNIVQKMYIDFETGHNFNDGDIGTTVTLVGFNSQELYNKVVTILSSGYKDPSDAIYVIGTGWTFSDVSTIGDNYIIVDEPYYDWYLGDSGMVRKAGYGNYTTSASTESTTINNGTFNNTHFNGDININSGVYNYVTMRNGITWNNGIFNGNYFQSLSGETENNWLNGKFYNGVFGRNETGFNENVILSIFNNGAITTVGDTTGSTNDYIITGIYPLLWTPSTNQQNNALLAFNITDYNPFEGNVYTHDRNILDESGGVSTMMNSNVWSDVLEPPIISNDFYSPYDFVFKIQCSTIDIRYSLENWINFIINNPGGNYYLDIIDPNILGDDSLTPFKKLRDLYGMDYSLHYHVSSGNDVYVIFRFNTIKDLYENSTSSEKEEYHRNFRNVWSIANTGYYTHPMPVLNESGTNDYGNEDLDKVGKMSIHYDSTYNTTNKWIYGTCPPPWWYNFDTFSIDFTIFFSEIGDTGSISEIGTFNGTGQISNNGTSTDNYMIPIADIYETLYENFYNAKYDMIKLETTNGPPYTNKFTSWLYHHIYQHKNHIGVNPSYQADFTSISSSGSTASNDLLKFSGITDTDFLNNVHVGDYVYLKYLTVDSQHSIDNDEQYWVVSSVGPNYIVVLVGLGDGWYSGDYGTGYLRRDLTEITTTGMTNYGISMYNQNDIYNFSATNTLSTTMQFLGFNNNYEKKNISPSVYSIGDVLWKRNFSDMVLFNEYYLWKQTNEISHYSLGFFTPDIGINEDPKGRFLFSIFEDMKNGNNFNSVDYIYRLTTNDRENFKKWNLNIQTSTQNFNKKVGLQLVSKNLQANIDGYSDSWYNGQFYQGEFYGKWYGGQWDSKNIWLGWNTLITPSGTTSFQSPNYLIGTIVKNKNFEVNYDLLKKQKLYYEIAPWDEANKKNTETVNLPLRKKERKF